PSRPRSEYPPPGSAVIVLTVAKVLAAPSCQTLTVPERSAQKSRPSGAKARAVALSAAIVPLGGDWGPTEQGPVPGAGGGGAAGGGPGAGGGGGGGGGAADPEPAAADAAAAREDAPPPLPPPQAAVATARRTSARERVRTPAVCLARDLRPHRGLAAV